MKNYDKKRPTAEDAVEAYHDSRENTDVLGSYTGICRDPGMRYGLSSARHILALRYRFDLRLQPIRRL